MEKLCSHTCFHLPLTAFTLFLTVGAFGQQYRYTFRVEQVTSPGEAKNITDPLRRVFNEPTDPYATFPWFNDTQDAFHFTCPLLITREKVEQMLSSIGYSLTEFTVVTTGEASGSQTE